MSRPCNCGGTLHRHRQAIYKTTGDAVLTLLCRACGKRISIYTSPDGKRREERRMGRPPITD